MMRQTLFACVGAVLAAAALAPAAASDLAPLEVDTFDVVIPVIAVAAAGTVADAAVTAMPDNCRVLKMAAGAAASTGTSPTLTVDFELGTTDIVTDPITVTAGAEATGTPLDYDIAAGGVVHIDTVAGGTSPTFTGIYARIFCARY